MRGKRGGVGRVREREKEEQSREKGRERERDSERSSLRANMCIRTTLHWHTVAMNILLLFLHVLLSDATQQKTFFSLWCMNVFKQTKIVKKCCMEAFSVYET